MTLLLCLGDPVIFLNNFDPHMEQLYKHLRVTLISLTRCLEIHLNNTIYNLVLTFFYHCASLAAHDIGHYVPKAKAAIESILRSCNRAYSQAIFTSSTAHIWTTLSGSGEMMFEYLAVPVVKGKNSELEKFAGGLYTTSVEVSVCIID